MAYSRKSYGNKAGATIRVREVSKLSEQQRMMLLSGCRDFWGNASTGGAGTGGAVLAFLSGSASIPRARSEADEALYQSGRDLAADFRAAVLSGVIPGWTIDEFGITVAGRSMGMVEKSLELATEVVDTATFGAVNLGDAGGVDDIVGDFLDELF